MTYMHRQILPLLLLLHHLHHAAVALSPCHNLDGTATTPVKCTCGTSLQCNPQSLCTISCHSPTSTATINPQHYLEPLTIPGAWRYSARTAKLDTETNLLSAELRTPSGDWIRAEITHVADDTYTNVDGRFVSQSLPYCASRRLKKAICTASTHADLYRATTTSQCQELPGHALIASAGTCKTGALTRSWEVHFAKATSFIQKHAKPPGCYQDGRDLYINKISTPKVTTTTNVTCSTSMPCLCRFVCLPGTFSKYFYSASQIDRSAPDQCKNCPAAHYSTEYGTSYCKKCPTKCPPGSMSNVEGQSKCACTLCPFGKYQPLQGENSCVDCSVGKYHQQTGATSVTACRLCAVGQFSTQTGSVACVPCPLDTTTASSGAFTRKQCTRCHHNKSSGYPMFSSGSRHPEHLVLLRPEHRCVLNVADYCHQQLLGGGGVEGGCQSHYSGACTRKICPYPNMYHPDSRQLFQTKYVAFPVNGCDRYQNTTQQHMNTSYAGCNTCKSSNAEQCQYGYCQHAGYNVRTGCSDCVRGWYKYEFNGWNKCRQCGSSSSRDKINPMHEGSMDVSMFEDVCVLMFGLYVLCVLIYIGLRPEALNYATYRKNRHNAGKEIKRSASTADAIEEEEEEEEEEEDEEGDARQWKAARKKEQKEKQDIEEKAKAQHKVTSYYATQNIAMATILPMVHQVQITFLLMVAITTVHTNHHWLESFIRFSLHVVSLDLAAFLTSPQCSLLYMPHGSKDQWLVSLMLPFLVLTIFVGWYGMSHCVLWCTKERQSKKMQQLRQQKKTRAWGGATTESKESKDNSSEETEQQESERVQRHQHRRSTMDRVVLRGGSMVFFVGIYTTVTKTALAIFDCDPENFIWSVAGSGGFVAAVAAGGNASNFTNGGGGGNISSVSGGVFNDACPFAPAFPLSPFRYPNNTTNNVYGVLGIVMLIVYCVLPIVGVLFYVYKHRSQKHVHVNVLDVTQISSVANDLLDWIMFSYRSKTKLWFGYIKLHQLLLIVMITSNLMEPLGLRFILIVGLLLVSIVLHVAYRPYRATLMNWIWILFDISHVIGIFASGLEYGVDFGESKYIFNREIIHTLAEDGSSTLFAPSPSVLAKPIADISNSSERRLSASYWTTTDSSRRTRFDANNNVTTTPSTSSLTMSNDLVYLYLLSILHCLVWCIVLLLKTVLMSMHTFRRQGEKNKAIKKKQAREQKKQQDKEDKKRREKEEKQGYTTPPPPPAPKDSSSTTSTPPCTAVLEAIALGPFVFVVGSINLLLCLPCCLAGIPIECIIRMHKKCLNTSCWNYDIGNLLHVWLLDELRMLLYAPIYIVLYVLNRYWFDTWAPAPAPALSTGVPIPTTSTTRRTLFCCFHHLTLQHYEEIMYSVLYQRSWSKQVSTTLSQRELRKEKLIALRYEYRNLWVCITPKLGKTYYYSRENPDIRKWKIPRMSYAEEQVRAFFTKKEYGIVMKSIGGGAAWKVLSWKERLQLLSKNQMQERKKKMQKEKDRKKQIQQERWIQTGRIKPPPLPPTKVLPVVDEAAAMEARFQRNIIQMRENKVIKKLKKKKKKEKIKKRLLKTQAKDAEAKRIQEMKDNDEFHDY